MLPQQSDIDVVIPYLEYIEMQAKLAETQEENKRLKEIVLQLKDEPEKLKFVIKQLQKKIYILSKQSLKNLQKLMQHNEERLKANQQIQELKSLIDNLESQLQNERFLFQQQLVKNVKLSEKIAIYKDTVHKLQNRLDLREQQISQLSIKSSENSKIIRQLSQKCMKYEQDIQKKSINERIIVEDSQADLEELREMAKLYETQNRKLRKQSEEIAKSLAEIAPIVQQYYQMMERHQYNILNNYSEFLLKYKRRLMETSLLGTTVSKQLTLKRDSIYRALQKEFQKIGLDD